MWQALQYVTSGLALVAFLAATLIWGYRYHLRALNERIAKAPPKERAALIDRGIRFGQIPMSGLSADQRFELALRTIGAQRHRLRLVVAALLSVALLFAILAAVAIVVSNPSKGGDRTRDDLDVLKSLISVHTETSGFFASLVGGTKKEDYEKREATYAKLIGEYDGVALRMAFRHLPNLNSAQAPSIRVVEHLSKMLAVMRGFDRERGLTEAEVEVFKGIFLIESRNWIVYEKYLRTSLEK